MIEVTVIRGDGTPFQFKFENDTLQAFLTEEAGNGHLVKVMSLTALGVPIAQPKAKTAGPGTARAPLPVMSKAEADAEAGKRANAEAKARAERK